MSEESLVEPILNVGASVVAQDAVGGALSGVGLLQALVRKLVPNATEALQAAVAEEIRDAVLRRLPELEESVRRLREAMPGEPTPTAVLTIVEGFAQAYAHAERSKRDCTLNALINAFDPKIYEEAMTRRLFALLDRLDYGDLRYLRCLASAIDDQYPWHLPDKMDFTHARRLYDEGLVSQSNQTQPLTHSKAVITAFGRHLLRFVAAHGEDQARANGNAPVR